ncbi:hypothetical protein C8F04DRAFT_1185644 [Mycena alexandri]|uniref:Uncharacterized protein n=1 Tax=Mycena alexandri TaxID=1745969 RepID=A0AAD6SPK6_9AGAR|nr:hypothetical protein C8F04DRAFT_1185644 [Mycena alexandri]
MAVKPMIFLILRMLFKPSLLTSTYLCQKAPKAIMIKGHGRPARVALPPAAGPGHGRFGVASLQNEQKWVDSTGGGDHWGGDDGEVEHEGLVRDQVRYKRRAALWCRSEPARR